MAKKWIAKAIKKPGALRRSLGVKKGQKIPAGKLAAAAKKGGKLGRRARLAKTLRKFHTGGVVPEEGAYLLQEGETVIPNLAAGHWRDDGSGQLHFVEHDREEMEEGAYDEEEV